MAWNVIHIFMTDLPLERG